LDTVGRPRITGDAWAAVVEIALVGNLVSPVRLKRYCDRYTIGHGPIADTSW
jgi:hypothetical protein